MNICIYYWYCNVLLLYSLYILVCCITTRDIVTGLILSVAKPRASSPVAQRIPGRCARSPSILVTTPIYKNHEKHQMFIHESPSRMYKHHVCFIKTPLEWTLVWLKALFFWGSEAVERMIQVTKSPTRIQETGNWEPCFKKYGNCVPGSKKYQ